MKRCIGITKISHHAYKAKVLFHALLIFSLFLIILPNAVAAAIYYVRAGATGAGNGLDWTNAYTLLPGTLVRGATYYIADGNYSEYDFNTANSGSTYIYIKKAIESNHGTATGWNSSYGDGVASFSSSTNDVLHFTTSYWDIDGQTDYGIKLIRTDEGGNNIYTFRIDTGLSHFSIKHIEMSGPGGDEPYTYSRTTRAFYTPGTDTTSDVTISHCSIHGFQTLIKAVTIDNLTIEYCKLYNAIALNSATYHEDVMYISGGSDNGVIRYNTIYNYGSEGLYWSGPIASPVCDGWYIYGNVFYTDPNVVPASRHPRGIEVKLTGYSPPGGISNMKIYNNTFVNLSNTFTEVGTDNIKTGGEFKNNLMYNAGSVLTDSDLETENNTVSIVSSIFNDFDNFDLRLRTATEAGISLSSPYNVDPTEMTRGLYGVWDRGAYEFTGAAEPSPEPSPDSSAPSSPTSLQIISAH